MNNDHWFKEGVSISESMDPQTFSSIVRADYEVPKHAYPYIVEQAVKSAIHEAMKTIVPQIVAHIDVKKAAEEAQKAFTAHIMERMAGDFNREVAFWNAARNDPEQDL